MKKNHTLWLTQVAMLAAIVVVMSLTPLGYFNYGIIAITFLMIPVAIGSVSTGPLAGGILGGVFGITALVQCFGGNAFGTLLMQLNPAATVVVMLVNRILAGVLTALIYKGLTKALKNQTVAIGLSTLSASLLNTVLYVGCLVLYFGNNPAIEQGIGQSIFDMLTLILLLNALVEAVVCTIVSTAVCKVLIKVLKK